MSKIDSLPPAHRSALLWFEDHAGQEVGWPEPLDGLFLLNKAKGIHKPAGWQYALSVRQTLDGPYADREIIELGNGDWTYDYCQEGTDPGSRDADFTNRALMQNIRDEVPVGVVRQVKKGRGSRYQVLGLAKVESWENGYFRLRRYAA